MTSTTIDLPKLAAEREKVLVVGPPGIGKTGRILSTAKQCKMRPVVFRASLSERIDFNGAMIPDAAAGVTRVLPLDVLHDLMHTKEPTLLFLDDLGQAPMDVQAGAMRLFDDGYLSPKVLIWGATNRPGDKAGVTALCEPLRSRFSLAFRISLPGKDDEEQFDDPAGGVPLSSWAQEVDNWCGWAMEQDAAPEIVAWHRCTKGRTLYQWKPHGDPSVRMPDYRGWATVMRLWKAGVRDLNTVGAAIGRPIAQEYLAFAELAHKLPSPDQVWMDPDGSPVPQEPQAQYLVSTFLGRAAEPKHIKALIKYIERLPRVFQALTARDVGRRLGARLAGVREWVSWWNLNRDLFEVNA